MKRKLNAICCAVGFALVSCPAVAQAALNWVQGTVTYQHIKEMNASGGTLAAVFDPANPSLVPSGSAAGQLNSAGILHYSSTTSLAGGGTSSVKARVGRVTNSTTAGIAIKNLTQVVQIDPTGARNASRLVMNLPDAQKLQWSTGSTSYTGRPYFSMTVFGTGVASVFINLGYYSSASPNTLGTQFASLNPATISLNSAQLAEGYTITVPSPSSSTLVADRFLHIIGQVILTTDKTSIPSFGGGGDGELTIVDSSSGFMDSQTHSTYVGTPAGLWLDPLSWASGGNPIDGLVPNADEARARFQNDRGIARGISIGAPVRAGVVEVVGSSTTQFSGSTITFNNGTNSTAAMLWLDDAYGDASLIAQMPVVTEVPLVLQNDSGGVMNLSGGFGSTASSSVVISKRGRGATTISGPITNTGGMTHNIEAGTMTYASNIAGSNVDFGNAIITVGSEGLPATLNLNATQGLTSLTTGVTGTVNHAAGTTLSSFGLFNDGSLNSSGIIDRNFGIFGFLGFTNNGRYVQAAGIGTHGFVDGSGSTTVGASAVVVAGRFRQASLTVNGNTTIRAGSLNNSQSSVSKLNSLAVAANRRFDLTNNSLVIDYSAASPRAALEALIATGRTPAATWAGNGIVSSTAGAGTPGKFSLGIAEASDTSFVGTFLGQPIDSTSVLIRYTLAADFNVDGMVNLTDFTKLAAGFGLPGRWGTGDANYDGIVNLLDFTFLSANFGQSAGESLRSAIPEPGGSIGLAAMILLRRAGRVRR